MRPTLPGTAASALLLALAACGSPDSVALQQARDSIAATLPEPYFEDLVIESVAVEGSALVQLVRSPEGSAAAIRAHPRFEELRQSEQDALPDLCASPAIAPLAATGARLVRRFIDREGDVFFEVEMPAHACDDATRE